MRILSTLAMLFLAVAIAAFPASAGKGPAVISAHAGHLQQHDHDHNDCTESAQHSSGLSSLVYEAATFSAPLAQDDRCEQVRVGSAGPVEHSSSSCCDMTSCHAFVLAKCLDAAPAEMNAVAHGHIAAFALPSGMASRLERPPRAG